MNPIYNQYGIAHSNRGNAVLPGGCEDKTYRWLNQRFCVDVNRGETKISMDLFYVIMESLYFLMFRPITI